MRIPVWMAALLAGLLLGCGYQALSVDLWAPAAEGDTAAIERYIEAGADLNAKEPAGGSTPLIIAAIFGQTEAARLLIENGAEVDIKNNDGTTALSAAAFFCHPETLKLLIENGANVNTTSSTGSTPLDTATAPWDSEIQGFYQMIGQIYEIPIDMERIQNTRDEIAEILRQNGGELSRS